MTYTDPYTEFYSKRDYDRLYLPPEVKTIDLWEDKLLYGRVDEKQNSVYISNTNMEQKIKQLDVDTGTFFALNFVADAFNDFKRYVQRANALGRIQTDGLFSSLVPKTAYTNMSTSYSQHLETFYEILVIYLRNTGRAQKIVTPNDFTEGVLDFLKDFPGRMPLTRTTYIKSRYFNPLSTGLMIELLNVDHDSDEKREECTEDETFEFYHLGARKHGFFIAKHAPWRLIADISSIPMQNYMSPTAEFLDENGNPVNPKTYGLYFAPGTATNLFSKRNPDVDGSELAPYYLKSYLNDIDEMKINIAKMWNQFVEDNPYQIETVQCSSPGRDSDFKTNGAKKFNRYKKVFEKRKPLPEDSKLVLNYFNQSDIMTDRFFVVAYKNVLKYENNIAMSETKNKRLDKTILKYYDSTGRSKTVDFINDYFKKIKGTVTNPSYCQSFTFCKEEEQKQRQVPSNVTIIQDTTIPTVGGTPSGGSGAGSSGY